ncbi:hypothetical protein BVER_03231c [Candidatus Burkholderia verschuerenii]|uniref:Trypsin-co-occurring domain-containing protein n=1 Tax=Candidatus Burkholderia verschuerenii TaxID=242163 RepID=A0A0L0MBX3_9BURK|nr:trypco2 family protein [Candidatus Burkholderia verschuerenii]KND59469.1 hypothetical protein BVER_03231c [Candidatus Burkholderia verschuerenii]
MDMNQTTRSSEVPLADAIEDLRAELMDALTRGKDSDLHFRLKPIELEMTIGITKKGEGKGSIKFWVVELGGSGSYENSATHRLKLVLEPVTGPDNAEALISDAVKTNPLEKK